jgi:myo-inositol-1(or 4)-monophosphatase
VLDIALDAARAGARIVRDAGLAHRIAEAKLPADYVTPFDRSSEEAIFEILQSRAPGIPILGEERGGQHVSTMWTVDPIDGTTNFTRNLPVVAVSVALVTDGRPELGVVIAPWLNLEFTAERNRGATRNGERLPRLSDPAPDSSVIATGFPTGHKKRRLALYRNVLSGALDAFEDIRRCGSSALDLCWTAAGTFDGFFELELGTWDVAVGAAFVLEVGGHVSDWAGGTDWLQTGDILAGPPRVHETLVDLATRARAAR